MNKVSAVAAVPTAVDVLSAFGVSYVSGVLSVVGVPAFAVVPILLASLYVLVVYCTAVSLSVYVRIVESRTSLRSAPRPVYQRNQF